LKKFGRNINIRPQNNLSELIENMDKQEKVLPNLRGFGRNIQNIQRNDDLSDLIQNL
jgi:hypothetical protein